MPLRVAIIGSGASGICMSRHLATDPEMFDVTCFDRLSTHGGLWNYSEDTGVDKHGLPVPYALNRNMSTNLPVDLLMSFPGYHFTGERTFAHHSTVKQYLQSAVEKFGIEKFVRFQFETLVTAVKPVDTEEEGQGTAWLVTSQNLKTDDIATSVFDRVIVCTGQFQFPRTIDLPGIDNFGGLVMHSKDYRGPEICQDKNVLLIGNALSAFEVLRDIQGKARKIYTIPRKSGHSILDMEKCEGVENLTAIREVLSNGVLLENKECREVDVIILAIGYDIQFPYLSADCGVKVQNNRITPLYQHIVNINHPTLLFLGYVQRVPHTPVSDLQARYIAALLRGDFNLPSRVEMLRSEEEDFQERVVSKGLAETFAHDFLSNEPLTKYCEEIAREARLEALPESMYEAYDTIVQLYLTDLANLKSYTIKYVDGKLVAEKDK